MQLIAQRDIYALAMAFRMCAIRACVVYVPYEFCEVAYGDLYVPVASLVYLQASGDM